MGSRFETTAEVLDEVAFDRVQTYELVGEAEAEARLYRPAALLRPNR